jgi:DNA-directed RNA polymerase subunit omega
MVRAHDSMIYPPVEDLLERVDSKFTLVTLAAKRARQINSYFNHLGDGLGSMVPPQVASLSRKPLSIGFEEVVADKIGYSRNIAPDDSADADAETALAASDLLLPSEDSTIGAPAVAIESAEADEQA